MLSETNFGEVGLPTLVLLAGGLATRLRPLTETIPKSMLEIAGRPFIGHQLALFRSKGVRRIVICAGYLGEKIRDYVNDGSEWDLHVDWSFDGPRLLGTGGAVKRALPYVGDEFLVTYGDSWLDIAYTSVVDAFRASNKPLLMTVFRNEGLWDKSNIEFANGQIRRYSKQDATADMHYIDYGLQCVRRDALNDWPDDRPFDLAAVYSSLVDKGLAAGYEAERRFYEIGSVHGLAEFNELLKETIK